MSSSGTFADFLTKFFELFAGRGFRGGDYLSYLNRPNDQRGGDEASIVDTAIVGPLLGILGFEPAERTYNQQRQNGRPDFAPADSLYGTCFVVEDKSTSLLLSFNLSDPDSHLSQLIGYMRSANVRLGWLTNGKQFTLWKFDKNNEPAKIVDIDYQLQLLNGVVTNLTHYLHLLKNHYATCLICVAKSHLPIHNGSNTNLQWT